MAEDADSPQRPDPADDDLHRPAGYPRHWEADVVLRDGTVAHVRPITPDDADRLRNFHNRQSAESIYLRFFAPLRELSDRDVYRFTHVDYHDRVALVVTLRDEIIGVGRFDRTQSRGGDAEVAFNISDHYQGKGIGSVLLEHLATIGREVGLTRFTAEVLPQNRKMLSVFRDAGYEVSHRFEDGVVAVGFDIEPTEASTAVRFAREHRAEASSMHAVLHPASVAVIGVSSRPDSVGHRMLANLQSAGFTGPLYAVNPRGGTVLGLPVARSVGEISDGVDLAVIAVPAASVLGIVDECAAANVRTLLIASGGFAESGPEGADLQDELRRRVRAGGMRLVGPNSFGVINADPQVRLNASFSPRMPQPGRFGLFAQSGALGIAILASADRRGLGVSIFASAGNRADVSGNDLMQYWTDDERTTVVGLYLESMGNPRKFSRIARALARTKPVIVVQSGISSHGAPPGHRIRATTVPQAAFDAMLRQAGVIRVENLHQLFDVAQLLLHQPRPRGDRVAVVTNSSALGALTAASVESWGLKVSHGPVSVAPDAGAAEFTQALRAAFSDDEVDSVVACFVPPLAEPDETVATAVRDAALASDKPCLATFLGVRGVDESLAAPVEPDGSRRAVPAYPMPEDAVRALAAATRYSEWLDRDPGVPVAVVGTDPEAAEALIDEVLADSPDGRQLTDDEVTALLGLYGIRVWPARRVSSPQEAVEAANAVGYPVILKSTSPVLRHQPGLIGVQADLADDQDVREAFATITSRAAPFGPADLLVQAMAVPGVSCVLTTTEDPLFGPVVGFSVAGPPTELFGDIGYRIPPLTDVDVSDLVGSVRAAPLLHGHRGLAPVHRAALDELVARVSVMADELPDLASVALNPVNAWSGGVDVLGAEVWVAPAQSRKDTHRRAMT